MHTPVPIGGDETECEWWGVWLSELLGVRSGYPTSTTSREAA